MPSSLGCLACLVRTFYANYADLSTSRETTLLKASLWRLSTKTHPLHLEYWVGASPQESSYPESIRPPDPLLSRREEHYRAYSFQNREPVWILHNQWLCDEGRLWSASCSRYMASSLAVCSMYPCFRFCWGYAPHQTSIALHRIPVSKSPREGHEVLITLKEKILLAWMGPFSRKVCPCLRIPTIIDECTS